VFRQAPNKVKKRARRMYRLWKANPYHPSLHFKQIHAQESMYSVRIGLGWRAIGLREGATMTWVWIGSHADYDKFIS
jgi:hypothetical protein